MANVNIKFNNKDYLLSCDDGQEDSLKSLTKFLDKKYTELQDKLVINRFFHLLAHMSDEEKTEVMSDHWDEYWSQKGETNG